MPKKIRIEDPQKNKIFKNIKEILNGKTYIDYNEDFINIFNNINFNKNIRKIRKVGDFNFMKTKIDSEDALMVFCILEFPIKDKDSIKLNEYIIRKIDFFEKLFIDLDEVKIFRHNDYNLNNHYIFIKILKTLNTKDLQKLKEEVLIESNESEDSVNRSINITNGVDEFSDITLT